MKTLARVTLGALLVTLLLSCRAKERELSANATYDGAPVIVISIDTLRADHLPAYGYTGVTTPNLDALRRDSILFTSAWSHVPLTLPSHTTLLTGKLPADNGVRDNLGYRLAATNGTSLPEVLHARGYATGAAVSAYVLRGETGLRALFDSYDDGIAFQRGVVLGRIERPGAETIAIAKQWIAQHRSRPFFYFVHLFEPHTPYEPPEPYRSAFPNPYDGEIAHADALVGSLLDDLKSSGIYDRAIIVLLSDHGEGLGDHGEDEHGVFLYREAIHVPLMIKLPKGGPANTTIDAPAGLIDILPTIASLTGSRVPPNLRGAVLTYALPSRRIFSESMYARLHLGWSDLRSLVDREHHFIDAPKPELYRMSDAPEKKNILESERRVYASFRKDVDQYPRTLQAPGSVSAEERKKMIALGYLTGAANQTGPLPDPKEHIAELALFNEATSLIASHEYERAIESLRALLQKNPKFSDALYQLALAYEATQQFEKAAATYRELLRTNPSMTEQVAIALGAIYLNLGRYDDAKAHVELALSQNPGGAHLLLGRIALARKRFDEAAREARAAAGDAHYSHDAVLLEAEVLTKQGRHAEALAVLDAAKSRGTFRNLELERANLLMHLGRTDDAIAAFREEIRLFPDNRDAYEHLAAVYLLLQRPADAESVFQSLVAAIPQRSSYILAAETFEQLGQRSAGAEWRRRAAAAP
ncbi:MAG TPA: sulfatase-like hydrolase/transferase [Thermoanaerobaculia bacterium]|nr:sulfatase-like hydrolase/transferase [Thermoanaerobaculia bacterium]